MMFLTDFADQAVVLPMVAAVALILVARGCWRSALVWVAVIGATFAVMLGLKVGLLSCGPVFGPWRLHSPSGHTAAAAVMSAGLAALVWRRPGMIWAAALTGAGVIAATRVLLGFHSVPEVLVGGAIGLVGAALFTRTLRPPPAGGRLVPVLAAIVLAFFLHGARLPAEAAIARASVQVLDFIPACRVAGQSSGWSSV